MTNRYQVKYGDLKEMEKYGFEYVLDFEIAMILRSNEGNVFIEPDGNIVTFHPELLEEAIKNGDVIEIGRFYEGLSDDGNH